MATSEVTQGRYQLAHHTLPHDKPPIGYQIVGSISISIEPTYIYDHENRRLESLSLVSSTEEFRSVTLRGPRSNNRSELVALAQKK
jgi:hypothetical protein